MHKKLAGYLFLSIFSFSFFTIVLHASAQAPETPLSRVLSQTDSKPPTPTLYVKPEAVQQQPKQVEAIPSPTPTVYIAPPKEETPQVLGSKAISTEEVKEVVIAPTAAPLPTAVPTQAPPPPPVAAVSAGDLEGLFAKYSGEFGVSLDDMKSIAKCESGFNTNADTGLYAGMFQFNASTWASTRNSMGLDPNPELRKNAEEAIRTAAFKIKNGGRGAWPNC